MLIYLSLLFAFARAFLRPRGDLALEIVALRQQLAVYTRQKRRPPITAADRVFWSALARLWSPWRGALVLVQPDTVIRWHRNTWRRYWTWKSRRRRPGRPRLAPELRELIQRLARENPRWGSLRILGELRKLGFRISAQSVRRYRRQGKPRPPSQSWRTFLTNHAPQLWASDFFTVPTVTMKTLYVFLFIAHRRRKLVHLNVTDHPTGEWASRQLVQATPRGTQPAFLIRDRDSCYGRDFDRQAARLGVQTILTPVRAPKANGVAERVIRTLRRECLDHFIVVNERHLRWILRKFVEHYNRARPHRTLDLETPTGPPARLRPPRCGRVVGHPVLGGLHHEYEWLAA